jgi:hypothetical protein
MCSRMAERPAQDSRDLLDHRRPLPTGGFREHVRPHDGGWRSSRSSAFWPLVSEPS